MSRSPIDDNHHKAIATKNKTSGSAEAPTSRTVGVSEAVEVAILDASGNHITALGGASSSFDHGGNSDVDTTAEQIVTASVAAVHGVMVKAHRDNTGIIYLGNSDVTAATADATDGFPIEAGEAVTIEIDNANKIYARASAVNQKLYWLAI